MNRQPLSTPTFAQLSIVLTAALAGALFVSSGCTVPKRGPTTAATPHLLSSVRDHTGAPVAQGALRGHWSVLWFYPKAQTSG